jgi:hypothetical protein
VRKQAPAALRALLLGAASEKLQQPLGRVAPRRGPWRGTTPRDPFSLSHGASAQWLGTSKSSLESWTPTRCVFLRLARCRCSQGA